MLRKLAGEDVPRDEWIPPNAPEVESGKPKPQLGKGKQKPEKR